MQPDIISQLLDQSEKHLIDMVPWPDFSDKPKVSFCIAHNGDHIFLKYDVEEKEVLARYWHINDPVFKDSCVEFFIAFDDERDYYNLEFNRLGTCLGSFGSERKNRTQLPLTILDKIKYDRTIVQKKSSSEFIINWTLTILIPVQVFCYHKISSLKNKKGRVNFYKCGDDLSEPHYLAWNNIISEAPDFHLPEFFGVAAFM